MQCDREIVHTGILLLQDNKEHVCNHHTMLECELFNAEKAKNDLEQASKRRLAEIESELRGMRHNYQLLTEKSDHEAQVLEQKKAQLEVEQQRVSKVMEELTKKEQELKQQKEEQDAKVKDWQERIATIAATQQTQLDSANMLTVVKEASDQVAVNEREWKELQLKADEALHKFVQSKKSMQDKVETLENWLSLLEHQVPLPEVKCLNELLRAVQHMNTAKKKCFISYAWNVDKKENIKLQAKLIQLKSDLMKAGIEVMLDVQNMEGDINFYMSGNIQQCDRVLLVSFLYQHLQMKRFE